MELSKEQIDNLYQFTRKHFVEWYDLQTELVDHLANDIEQILSKQPHLSFEEARDKAFKKFGVFGFMEVVEQKQKQLNKRYLKLVLKEFKAFFTIPKIALTLTLYYLVYLLLFQFKISQNVFFSFVLVLSIYPLIFLFKSRKKLQEKVKQTGKKYLFEEYVTNLGGIVGGISIPLQITLQARDIHQQTTAIWLSVFLVSYALVLHISIFIMPKKIQEIMIKEHPEYNLIQQ